MIPLRVDPDALVSEGKRIQDGDDVTPENTRAFSLFCQAALAGNSEAQFQVAECFRLGRGVQKDEAQALAWLLKSAESGLVKACIRLGIFYRRSILKDDEEAIKWYQKAAETGCHGACVVLAGIYKDRGDFVGELKWDKELALQGNPESLWEVRTFYEGRDGVEVDLPEACAWLSLFEDSYTTRKNSEEMVCFQLDPESSKYKTTSQDLKPLMSASQIDQGNRRYQDLVKQRVGWIRKGAEEGSESEQYNLGWCYRDGYGVSQDGVEGARWWRMAAEQGERRAQNNLGHCYKYAEGVEENHEEAVGWFRKAAEQGHGAAQDSLGHSYCMGWGVPQDYDEGAQWIRKSADAGNRGAQHNLGFLYENGWGVPQDNAQALVWYRYAAARGHSNSKEEAERLAALMASDEVERATELFDELEEKRIGKLLHKPAPQP